VYAGCAHVYAGCAHVYAGCAQLSAGAERVAPPWSSVVSLAAIARRELCSLILCSSRNNYARTTLSLTSDANN
jgi:hypothetical protein